VYRKLQAPENDLSTEELFARAIEDLREGDSEHLDALVALHGRPTQQVIDACLGLCRSARPHERSVGVRVLRELRHPWVDPAVIWDPVASTVRDLVESDVDPDVVRWAISCLGYKAKDPASAAAVMRHVGHPDAAVRFAVAAALPGIAAGDEVDADEAVIEVLTALADDPDADVRAYALMGLVDDLELTEQLRPLLEAHVDDPDDHIRRLVADALRRAE